MRSHRILSEDGLDGEPEIEEGMLENLSPTVKLDELSDYQNQLAALKGPERYFHNYDWNLD